jgi:hypothetical protein
MSAVHFRAPLVWVTCACLSASFAEAEPPAAAGRWAKVPPLSELCYQSVNAQQQDPFFARLEAAKTAVQADRERIEAV